MLIASGGSAGDVPAPATSGDGGLSGDCDGLAIALIGQFGVDASRHALRSAEICLIRGQSAGYAAWRQVLGAIERLEAAALAERGGDGLDPAFAAGPIDPLLRARDAAAAR